jgi:hypothetical protein
MLGTHWEPDGNNNNSKPQCSIKRKKKTFKPKKSSPRFYSSTLSSALATRSSRMDHSRMGLQENCKRLVHLELFWIQTALLSWSESAALKVYNEE